MIVGIPREIKEAEYRVAITPGGVKELVNSGHRVLVEKEAGAGSSISDAEFKQAGAEIMRRRVVFEEAELVVKVKEPVEGEPELLHEGQILFTFLHLAPQAELTQRLLKSRVTGIGYETVELNDGSLPILTPMSVIAGRLATQAAAFYLEKTQGGKGILMGGVPGVLPAEIVILGCGTVGYNALRVAAGMGGSVTVIDRDLKRLSHIDEIYNGMVKTLASNITNIAWAVEKADALIGAVLKPGARAPIVVTAAMIKTMKPGSVIVDVSIDQGGCIETSKPTTHDKPTYNIHGVIHYCVTNIPALVPRTSTYALTNTTLPYIIELANNGFTSAIKMDKALAKGVNVYDGKVTSAAVAQSLDLPYTPIERLMKN